MAPEDLARVRFARSPLDELVQSFLVLLGRKGVDLHRPWVTATRPRLAGLDLSLLEALTSVHRYLPDFIMPPPRDAATTFAAELERVRATDPGEVRRSLAYWSEDELPQALRPLYDDPARGLGRLADTLTTYWSAAIEPVWPRLCALHDADLAYRSSTLTVGGLDKLFADLHPQVEYAGDRVVVTWPHYDVEHRANGAGVLLIPCAFVWPKLTVFDNDRYQTAIVYPARGVGQVWTGTPRKDGRLSDLVGRSRATLLVLLDLPQSTTQLANYLGVTPATVSEHLAVLRRNRLVDSRRAGRAVLYARTELGSKLLLEHS